MQQSIEIESTVESIYYFPLTNETPSQLYI